MHTTTVQNATTPAGYPMPLGWDDMGSSERDLYEERMARAAARRLARAERKQD